MCISALPLMQSVIFNQKTSQTQCKQKCYFLQSDNPIRKKNKKMIFSEKVACVIGIAGGICETGGFLSQGGKSGGV